jgi:Putative Actinobacterial Holin-X, holin superfamily III
MESTQTRHSARELATGLVDDAQRMGQLQLELAKQELKELAIRNGIAAGLLVAAGGLVLLAVFVMVPLVVVTWQPDHLRWALIFLAGYLAAAIVLAFTGRFLLRFEPPRRTLETLKETREWALRQISSNDR